MRDLRKQSYTSLLNKRKGKEGKEEKEERVV